MLTPQETLARELDADAFDIRHGTGAETPGHIVMRRLSALATAQQILSAVNEEHGGWLKREYLRARARSTGVPEHAKPRLAGGAVPAPIAPVAPPSLEEIYGDLSHIINPAVGFIRLADADGDPEEIKQAHENLNIRLRRAAEHVVGYFNRKEN